MTNPTSNYGFVLPTATDLVTDLPADFEVALQGVDTRLKALQPGTTLGDLAYSSATANTNTRLPVGTNGQVLAVVAGVPAWQNGTTGDIEGVTAGVGITGGGTSGTVTVTNSMATAITTAGDLIKGTGSGTFDRLGIGSSGQILTVSAGAPAWATPAASGGWTLLTSGSLPTGASTVTLSSISQSYKNLRLILKKMRSSTDADNFNMRWNGVTTSTHSWRSDFSSGTSAFSQSGMRLMDNIDNTTQNGYTFIDLIDYTNATTYKQYNSYGYNTNTLTTSSEISRYVGGSSATSAISSLTIYSEGAANFGAGTYELYGEN